MKLPLKLEFIITHLSMRLCSGIAAATMFMPEKQTEVSETQLRVAFDGDAVLFSDESERIFKAHGLDKFFEHERENEDTLLDHVCSFLLAISKAKGLNNYSANILSLNGLFCFLSVYNSKEKCAYK